MFYSDIVNYFHGQHLTLEYQSIANSIVYY